MSIYPLSPKARTNANSPDNTWSRDSLCNTSPHVPPESRGYLACLELPWRLLLSPISPTEPLSTQHSSILLLLHFPCSKHICSAEITPWQRLCSTKELILTRFLDSITPFCTTVATTSAPYATGPVLEDKHLIQKFCSQTG